MKGRIQQILIIIIGCLTFLSLPVLLAPDFPRSMNIVKSIPTQRTLIAYLLMIIFFFVNYFVLIPKFYFTKKYVLFIFCTILFFFAVAFIPRYIIPENNLLPAPEHENFSGQRPPPPNDQRPPFSQDGRRNPPPPYNEPAISFNITQHLYIFVAVAFLSLMLSISNRWKQAEKEKLSVELSYLKAQINPHFLFNTLNSIYSLAIEKSDNTAEAVVKLSAMMRYVLSEAGNDFVPLEKEIAYMHNYIELQQIRFADSVKVSFTVDGKPLAKKIAPIILIPFVENAFKYGVNAEEDSSIKVAITITENGLQLFVMNNKVHVHQSDENKSGVGIENTKGRLRLLYPSRHSLEINDHINDFSVLLTLQLT